MKTMSNVATSVRGALNASEPPLTQDSDLLLVYGQEASAAGVHLEPFVSGGPVVVPAPNQLNNSIGLDRGVKQYPEHGSPRLQSQTGMSVFTYGQIPQTATSTNVLGDNQGIGSPLPLRQNEHGQPLELETPLTTLSQGCMQEEASQNTVYLNEQQCYHVMKLMKSQRAEGCFCDVVLHIQGLQYWAHRSVLSANSSYFDTLLAATRFSPGPDQLVLPGLDHRALEVLLEYMYSGHLSVSLVTAGELLRLSSKFNMDDVKQCCGIHLAKNINLTNWAYIQSLAEEYAIIDLNASVVNFVHNNLGSVSQSNEILTLPGSSLKSLLKEWDPDVSNDLECCRLKVVFRWVNFQFIERKSEYAEMVSLLKSDMLTFDSTRNLLKECGLEESDLASHPVTLQFLEEILQQEQLSNVTVQDSTCNGQLAKCEPVAPTIVKESNGDAKSDSSDGAVGNDIDRNSEEPCKMSPRTPENISSEVDETVEKNKSDSNICNASSLPMMSNKSKRKSTNPRRITLRKGKTAQQLVVDNCTNRTTWTKTSKRCAKKIRHPFHAVTKSRQEPNKKVTNPVSSGQRSERSLRPKRKKLLKMKEEPNEDMWMDADNTLSEKNHIPARKTLCKAQNMLLGTDVSIKVKHSDGKDSSIDLPAKQTRMKKAQKECDMLHCPKCPRLFPTPSALKHHMKGHGSDVPFLCEVCGFTTVHFGSMNVHRRQHNGKKFKCTYEGCGYETIRRCRLDDHLNGHQGVKNHICSVCGKAFIARKHLHRHEKIHSNVKLQACEHCDYSSSRRDKLREHMKKHHPEIAIESGWLTQEEANALTQTPKPRRVRKKKEVGLSTLKQSQEQMLQQLQPQPQPHPPCHSLLLSPVAEALSSGQLQLMPSAPSVVHMGNLMVDGSTVQRPGTAGGPIQPHPHVNSPNPPAPTMGTQVVHPVTSQLAGTTGISEEMMQYLTNMTDHIQMQTDAPVSWTYQITPM